MMKRNSLVLALGSITVGAVLSGCSSWFAVGETEYSCKAIPNGTRCTNTSKIYELSNNGEDPAENEKSKDSEKEKAAKNNGGNKSDFVIDNFVTPNLPNRPVPVRTPAVVMRIWYAPYTDADGNFMVPGYSYVEIEPRKWTLGVNEHGSSVGTTRVFEPLKTNSN